MLRKHERIVVFFNRIKEHTNERWFICRTTAALRFWLLTSGPAPVCPCKPFSCKAYLGIHHGPLDQRLNLGLSTGTWAVRFCRGWVGERRCKSFRILRTQWMSGNRFDVLSAGRATREDIQYLCYFGDKQQRIFVFLEMCKDVFPLPAGENNASIGCLVLGIIKQIKGQREHGQRFTSALSAATWALVSCRCWDERRPHPSYVCGPEMDRPSALCEFQMSSLLTRMSRVCTSHAGTQAKCPQFCQKPIHLQFCRGCNKCSPSCLLLRFPCLAATKWKWSSAPFLSPGFCDACVPQESGVM